MDEPKRVEETRRGVAMMAVEEPGYGKTASNVLGMMAGKAKSGWEKVKGMMEGKRMARLEGGSGSFVVSEGDKKAEAVSTRLEWDEEIMGGTVEIEEEDDREEDGKERDETRSTGSSETRGGGGILEFMEDVEVEERESTLDEKVEEGRKRKREDEVDSKKRGLNGLPGWERRSKKAREDDRWYRNVVSWDKDEKGNVCKKEEREKIPLPEKFALGIESKGMEMNNSGRLKNNLGTNRESLFPGGPGMKSETRNWLASFTKTGCVSCRDEEGRLNHRGRDGLPVTLIVGDESIPNVVGYTTKDRNGGRGDSCAWILKVEHLGLEEVSGILRKINLDKRAADRALGKREHEFFIPNGSKILVASYVHLRKEGFEGYVGDFNNMVKNIGGVTGDTGIEVLPVVPVVRDGIDKHGRELIGMVREWVEWIGVKSGRESVRKLSGTSGGECETGTGTETVFQWKPSFLQRTKEPGKTDRLTTLTGDRTETRVRAAERPRELEKMKHKGKTTGQMDTDSLEEEVKRLQSEENGISLEGEFAFGKAVGEFLREEVRAGNFKGNYILNLKDQLRMRELREQDGEKRLRVLVVGASQMWRIGEELMRKDGVEVTGCVLMEGENTERRNTDMLRELKRKQEDVDIVVVGGPTNSLVRHGREGARGFGGERLVKVCRKENGQEMWKVTYHLTDPVKISMVEKAELVDRFTDLLQKVKETVGDKVDVLYVTMFPRFAVSVVGIT